MIKTDVWYDYQWQKVRIKGDTGQLSSRKHKFDEVIDVGDSIVLAMMLKSLETKQGLYYGNINVDMKWVTEK